MNEDQIQRNIEFIIAQQATFAGQQAAQQAESAERMSRIETNIVKLTDVTLSLANVAQDHEKEITDLDVRVKEGKRETDAALKALAEAGKETDERLNAVILLFERSFGKIRPE